MRLRVLGVALGAALLVATGGLLAGRATVDTSSARTAGYQDGQSKGYLDGLRAGQAQGRQEGRSLSEVRSLPQASRQPVQGAFNDGYAAGANDEFAGYDGGWTLNMPYLITLERGSGRIAYRVSGRDLVAPGVNYYLCADGHTICKQPRH
jgi:hypothetical protein